MNPQSVLFLPFSSFFVYEKGQKKEEKGQKNEEKGEARTGYS